LNPIFRDHPLEWFNMNMTDEGCPFPVADGETGLQVLKGMAKTRSLLTALTIMQDKVGNAFRVNLPGFKPVVMAGPEANRQVMVTERQRLSWRSPSDPVTRLLRQGVLVVDGELHDELRLLMNPSLQKPNVLPHIGQMWRSTEQIAEAWKDGDRRDMLVEMRRIALLILVGSLFSIDFTADMPRMWQPIMKLLAYISPGLWIIWPDMPRPKYRGAIQEMDDFLYQMIQTRREQTASQQPAVASGDLLDARIAAGLSDDLIRDQLLTMLIAGHDTSTALLAWVLFLLGSHPQWMAQVKQEVDAVLTSAGEPPTAEQLGQLHITDQVIKEALRIYPPIHVGNRFAKEDMNLQGYRLPAGTRLMSSIYLTHRDKNFWPEPEQFRPERFERSQEQKRPPLAYVPFGGGPRNCIGAAFAQVEAKVVLGRLLQCFDFELLNAQDVRPYMGATLEPRPRVMMRVRRRGVCKFV
jgi:cytochrome P450